MIASLKGTVQHIGEKEIILNVSGVGYQVFCTSDILLSTEIGDELFIWTAHVVREQSNDLYGFKEREALHFFNHLQNVSGIGPRSALSIIGLDSLTRLRQAIGGGDIGYLTKISGIGKKTAEKILIELRDKMEEFAGETIDTTDVDVLEALQALGYSNHQAREAMKNIDPALTGADQKIKAALSALNS